MANVRLLYEVTYVSGQTETFPDADDVQVTGTRVHLLAGGRRLRTVMLRDLRRFGARARPDGPR